MRKGFRPTFYDTQFLVIRLHGPPQDLRTEGLQEAERSWSEDLARQLPCCATHRGSRLLPQLDNGLLLVGWRERSRKGRDKRPFHPEGHLPLPFPPVCQNCIKLNVATVSGFVFVEIISIFFLAVGIYFIAGQDGVRQSRGKRMFLTEI